MTEDNKNWLDLEQLLAEGNSIQLRPRGYSMYPLFIPGRDEAIISPVEKPPRRGDVVLYRRVGSILVLHRIWKVDKTGYYMVGDNQSEVEGPLEESQIKGILTEVIRKGKRFSVKDPVYRILFGIWLWLRPFRPKISQSVSWIKGKIVRKE